METAKKQQKKNQHKVTKMCYSLSCNVPCFIRGSEPLLMQLRGTSKYDNMQLYLALCKFGAFYGYLSPYFNKILNYNEKK